MLLIQFIPYLVIAVIVVVPATVITATIFAATVIAISVVVVTAAHLPFAFRACFYCHICLNIFVVIIVRTLFVVIYEMFVSCSFTIQVSAAVSVCVVAFSGFRFIVTVYGIVRGEREREGYESKQALMCVNCVFLQYCRKCFPNGKSSNVYLYCSYKYCYY